MLEAGLLKGDALTVTGRSLAQEASAAKETGPGSRPRQEHPLKSTGG